MSRIFAIYWNRHQAQAVVVKWRATSTSIEAVLNVPLAEDADAEATGRSLAEALAPYRKGGQKTIVCVDRDKLQWQQLSLPPAAAEELPELVRFQFERDLASTEEEKGFDYLPLSGDEQSPHQVLAIGISPDELAEIRQVVDSAELKLDRLVPIQVGRIALVRRAVAMQKEWHPSPDTSHVFAVLTADDATIWAMVEEKVVLLRTLRLPQGDESASLSQPLINQLQRTRLALGQSHPMHPVAGVWLAGKLANRALTGTASAQLDLPVHAIDVTAPLAAASYFTDEDYFADEEKEHSGSEENKLTVANGSPAPTTAHFPLSGLALDETENRVPLVDLVNPRHAVEPPDRGRTYALSTAAVVSLLALVGWQGYRNISIPQQAAALAEQELAELEKPIKEYKKDETQASAIRKWTSSNVHLLNELEILSTKLRPEPLSNKDFLVDSDLVVQNLNLQGQQFTLDAVAKNKNAVSQLEARLRDDRHRVSRENVKQTATLETYTTPLRLLLENADEASTIPEGNQP